MRVDQEKKAAGNVYCWPKRLNTSDKRGVPIPIVGNCSNECKEISQGSRGPESCVVSSESTEAPRLSWGVGEYLDLNLRQSKSGSKHFEEVPSDIASGDADEQAGEPHEIACRRCDIET